MIDSSTRTPLEVVVDELGRALRLQSWLYLIFGSGNGQILSDAVPEFWNTVRRAFESDLCCTIARLADRSSVAGRSNLSIQGLLDEVSASQTLRESVDRRLTPIRGDLRDVLEYRHRGPGHADREIRLRRSTVAFKPEQLDRIMRAMGEAIDDIAVHLGRSRLPWAQIAEVPARHILSIIEAGQKHYPLRSPRSSAPPRSPNPC